MISLPSYTSHTLQPLDVACFKPFKSAFRAYRNKWMQQSNGRKVKKKTLAYWVDLALGRALSKSNTVAGFRATGIWSLNLDKMETKVKPSKPVHSMPLEKLIVHEIMEDDLSMKEEDAKHFYIEDEDEVEHQGEVGPTHPPSIGHFLKLPQKYVQAPRIVHEPLVDYSQSQNLTSNQHIQSMENIAYKKNCCTREGGEGYAKESYQIEEDS